MEFTPAKGPFKIYHSSTNQHYHLFPSIQTQKLLYLHLLRLLVNYRYLQSFRKLITLIVALLIQTQRGTQRIQKQIRTKALTRSYFLASKFLHHLNETDDCIFGNTAIRFTRRKHRRSMRYAKLVTKRRKQNTLLAIAGLTV